MVAARFFAEGKGPTEVAELLGVAQGSASRWKQAYDGHGKEGLRAKRHPGKKSRLRSADRERLAELLLLGPGAQGFPTEVWTLSRVATLVEQHFRVKYSQSGVWRILRAMGWSCHTLLL